MSIDDPEATQGLPEGEAVETSATETAPAPDTEQDPQSKEEETPAPKHKPWFQERIDQLTREKHEARREAESYRTIVDSLNRGERTEANPNVDVDALANTKAVELVKAQQFNDKCNAVYTSGTTEFSDFDQTLANFSMLGGLPSHVLEAVTQLPDAHKVLHSLGQDMDAAARILSLPPVPMAVELAKLSLSPRKTAPVSNAPRPITPIDGAPKGEPDPEKMGYKEWEEWREAQLKKRS